MILFMVGSDVIEFGDGEKSNIFVASMVVLIAYERGREKGALSSFYIVL